MIQTTNIRRILDRAMRHPMLRDIPFETAVEYAVDFISLMGTPALYNEKTAVVKVHNWRGQLPCDFEHMIQVRVAGAPANKKCDAIIEQTNDMFDVHTYAEEHNDPGIVSSVNITKYNNGGYPAGAIYRYSGHSFHMSDSKMPRDISELTYKIQGMVIFTSTKETDVEIAYRAFATDDEGYPLLPDNPSFLRGLENYIKLQWFTILYDMGKLPQQVLQNTQQEYAWAAGDAQSEFSRLSLDEAETLFNSFKTLLPRNNEHWKAFFTNGAKEIWRH